jgi:hypothetical protein
MSQFRLTRSPKAAQRLEQLLRRHKLLEHGRAAFVDRPDDDGRRRPIPRSRAYLLGARIHDLGPRALAELLIEILSGCDALARIEKYAELDPAIVAVVGARDLPPAARTVRRPRARSSAVSFSRRPSRRPARPATPTSRRLSAMARVTPPDGGKPSFSATMRWPKSFGLAMATRSRSPASSIARPTKPIPARTA